MRVDESARKRATTDSGSAGPGLIRQWLVGADDDDDDDEIDCFHLCQFPFLFIFTRRASGFARAPAGALELRDGICGAERI